MLLRGMRYRCSIEFCAWGQCSAVSMSRMVSNEGQLFLAVWRFLFMHVTRALHISAKAFPGGEVGLR